MRARAALLLLLGALAHGSEAPSTQAYTWHCVDPAGVTVTCEFRVPGPVIEPPDPGPVQPLPATSAPVLSVAPSDRYLRLDGQPFFYVADTGWHASWSLTTAEITQYLEDRQAKGVRVIQGLIIGRSPVLPPYDGGPDDPFIDTAPMTLNDSWWVATDHAIREAARLGMIITLSPVWGSSNDVIFPDPARHVEFVSLIAKRYSNQSHVLYIAAGEYDKITDDGYTTNNRPLTAAELARYNAVTTALRANAHPQSLIVYHPDGWHQPSIDFGADARVQFNMLQSSGSIHENIRRIPMERASTLQKPVIEAEIGYESDTRTAWHQRVPAYHTLMQGGAGFAYGHSLIWKFSPGWQAAMQAEGGVDVMTHFRQFAQAIHDEGNVPAQDLVLTPGNITDTDNSYATALRSADRSKLYAFVSNGRTFNLNVQTMAARNLSARWWDPRNGGYSAPFPVTRAASVAFNPPGNEAQGNDWQLRIDASSQAGRLQVPVLMPTENEDGTPVRPPLTAQLERTPPAGGLVADAQYGNGLAWVDGVPSGSYTVRARARDADGELSAWSGSTIATVPGGSMAATLSISTTREGTDPPGTDVVPDRDLTALGDVDWLRVAESAVADRNFKSGGSAITSFADIGSPANARGGTTATQFQASLATYTDGTSPTTSAGSRANLRTTVNGAGWRTTIALGGNRYRVRIGSGQYDGTHRIAASLSDSSASSVSLDNVTGSTTVGWWTTEIIAEATANPSDLVIDITRVSGGGGNAGPQLIWIAVEQASFTEADSFTAVGTALLDLAMGKVLAPGGIGTNTLDLNVGIPRAFSGIGTALLDLAMGKVLAPGGIGTNTLDLNVGIPRAFSGIGTAALAMTFGVGVSPDIGGTGTPTLDLNVGKPLAFTGVGSVDLTLNVGKFFGYTGTGSSVMSRGDNFPQAGSFTGTGTALLETQFNPGTGLTGMADPATRFKEPFDLSYWRTKYERQQAIQQLRGTPDVDQSPTGSPRTSRVKREIQDTQARLARIKQRDQTVDQDIADLTAYIDGTERLARALVKADADAKALMDRNAAEAALALEMARKRQQQLRNQKLAAEIVIRMLLT